MDVSLGAFLRAHSAEILGIWEQRVRALPAARRLPRPLLMDHVPAMLERAAAFLEAQAEREEVEERAEQHGSQRIREGFELEEALVELAILRDAALQARGSASVLTGDEAILVVRAFDPLVSGVVRQYA